MHFQHKGLSASEQYFCLSTAPICRGKGSVRRQSLLWEFEARPTILSRLYRVRIQYRYGGKPDVYVLEPDLVTLSNGRRLPHVYQQHPTRLCLFLPGVGEWLPYMPIDRTIVPWCYLWLFYFEDWLGTGEWRGGGVHPRENHGTNATNSFY